MYKPLLEYTLNNSAPLPFLFLSISVKLDNNKHLFILNDVYAFILFVCVWVYYDWPIKFETQGYTSTQFMVFASIVFTSIIYTVTGSA